MLSFWPCPQRPAPAAPPGNPAPTPQKLQHQVPPAPRAAAPPAALRRRAQLLRRGRQRQLCTGFVPARRQPAPHASGPNGGTGVTSGSDDCHENPTHRLTAAAGGRPGAGVVAFTARAADLCRKGHGGAFPGRFQPRLQSRETATGTGFRPRAVAGKRPGH